MKIILNENAELVKEIKAKLKANDGYCPCATKKEATTLCMCKAFREQEEPGECHCGLYVKIKMSPD